MGSSIAKRTATAVREKPYESIVAEINKDIRELDSAEVRLDNLRLCVAQNLLRLRQRVSAEGKDWWEWFATSGIERSRKDCEKLMRIAGAEDSEAALEVERDRDRERKRIARGADNGNVRSITRHVEAGCCSGDFVTVLEVEPKGLDQPRKRRTLAQRERDALREHLVRITGLLRDGWVVLDPSDAPPDLLTTEEKTTLVEAAENKIAELENLVDWLRR